MNLESEKKNHMTDDVYKYLVKEFEYARSELERARNKDYEAWKKMLQYENEHFGSKHLI